MRRLVFFVTLLWCSPASAGITGIKVTPENPVMGWETRYEAEGDDPYVQSYKWEY